MSEQTENYIVLKSIAEKYNKVASSITEDEIRQLIKSVLKEKLDKLDFTYQIDEILTEYLDGSKDEIVEMFKKSLMNKIGK
jgi:uncharacterized membrane-anchored protein YjiN (DUF445 family)